MPDAPSPEIRKNVWPALALRQRPPLPAAFLVAATIALPRATTPTTLSPASVDEPIAVQVLPPSVVRKRPLILPASRKLLTLARPATTVLYVESVRSSEIAPIDMAGPRSRSGVQVGFVGEDAIASVV